MLARSDHQPHDDLLVAVCAFEPDGARLGETLESLAREGADPVVVVSDADPWRQEAERTAWSAPGVTRVDNQITIMPGAPE